jgi:hypothetical protein
MRGNPQQIKIDCHAEAARNDGNCENNKTKEFFIYNKRNKFFKKKKL